MKNKEISQNHKTICKLILVIVLVLISNVMPVWAVETQQKQANLKNIEGQTNKYPPYPDIWDWQVPKGDRPAVGLDVKKMDNGDVMISYHKGDIIGPFIAVSFFGRNKIMDYEAVFKGDYTSDAKSRIPFKDNTILSGIGGGWRSGGCLDALNFGIVIRDESGQKILMNRTLLYIFDKPLRYETHPHCMIGPSFNYQVAAVAADFLHLKDGTFLLVAHVEDNDYIIRFDENFQTKSKLINKKFFWMETDALRAFDTGYGDRAEGGKRLKQLYADLYRKLMNIKQGRTK